ncbi:MAG: glycosyltransferase family 4 protein [Mojavia pulchra JT2-VF2]|jgi:glycosyltransferase involved in cell wall biosynthesis|uniref:Glycosyltransferase family 4 protein n=1 Tax=Mojavia pulchra JT2-VF2 TaxID=287848 RepID=A0A951PX49_9NOST|nr:glycosyltransferase family 4 protein [Mojavia pulchra JT2-VF2]
MKIVYDYQIFNEQKYGGISRYICEVANRIAQIEGFDVKILACSYINKHLESVNPELVIGMQRQHIPKTKILIDKLNAQFSKFWLKSNKPSIIHETYYSTTRIAPKGSRTVVTVYDMIHEKFNFLLNNKLDRELTLSKIEATKRADHIICISNSTKQDLLEILDINPDKVSVIYLGHSLIHKSKIDWKLNIQSKPYILYVGQRAGYKNFERLLQAYASNQNIQRDFNLICCGANSFSTHELDLICKLGLNGNKVIHVTTDDQALVKLYREASVFIYPSLYEGFGLPLLEAMSLECPVVCSNTSSLPEVAGEAAEFFDPYSTESIANSLEKVLYSSERAKNLIKLGKQRVKAFSWEACAKQTCSLYRSLI